MPKELTKQESAVPWSPHGPTELNRRDVFVSVCLLVGGVHAPRGNHDGSLGKVLGVGVPVTVPHTRHEQPREEDGRSQHTESIPWTLVLYEVGHLDHPLLPVKCEAQRYNRAKVFRP